MTIGFPSERYFVNKFFSLSINCIISTVLFLCVLAPAVHAAAPTSASRTGEPVPELILPLSELPSSWAVNFRHSLSNTERETIVMSAANSSPAQSSRMAMGNLRLAREYSLLPDMAGTGFSYSVKHKKHQLQAHVLKDESRYSSRQITGASLNIGLPLATSVSVSAVSGAETTPYRSLASQMVLVKGTFARPAFQLNGELGMSLLQHAMEDQSSRSSDKAYRISGQGEWLGIRYDGVYEYTGPRYRFLSRTVQQPDTIKKTVRARRDTPIGGVLLSLTESETNVDDNQSYQGSFRRLAEVEYAPKFLKAFPTTLLLKKGEAGVEVAGGGSVATTKIDVAGGTIQVALDQVDVKVKTVHTWVSDHDSDEELSKEMVLEVSPQLHLSQIRFEPRFSLQRRLDIPYDAVRTVYNMDFLVKKQLKKSKTSLDLAWGYTGRNDDQSGRSDTYRSKVGAKWMPKELPLGFTQAHLSLGGDFTREKYFWDRARNGYSFMMTLELS